MSKALKNKSIKIGSIAMAIVLLFPFTVNALHLFGHDDHTHCTETGTTHFHQKNLDCELCDFHLTTILYFYGTQEFDLISSNFKTIFPPIEDSFIQRISFYFNLRGPPQNA